MRKRSMAFLALAGTLLCGLHATTGGRAAEPAEEKEQGGEGEYVIFTKDHPTGTAKPDRALLYVLRPTSVGAAIKSFFFVDDTIVGINRGSSYFFVDVPPGRHVLWSKSENVDAVEMVLEAGKTYYVQQQVQMGGFKARTKLEVLSDEDGRVKLEKCSKHGTLGPAGKAKGAEYAATLKANVQEDLDRRAREAAEAEAKAQKKAQKAQAGGTSAPQR